MRRFMIACLALAAFSAAMWFVWLGWDQQYYLVDGVPQGPYRPSQVVGCGFSIAVATVAAYAWLRRPATILVLPTIAIVSFAIPWGVDASSDETGLWVFGLMMLLVGGEFGLTFLLVIAALALRRE